MLAKLGALSIFLRRSLLLPEKIHNVIRTPTQGAKDHRESNFIYIKRIVKVFGKQNS